MHATFVDPLDTIAVTR